MAVYPCDVGMHRYPGAQRSAYLSIVGDGGRPETRKLRLCAKHFGDMRVRSAERLLLVEEDSQMSPVCDECGDARSNTLFVRLYAEDGEEPVQYAGDLCATHVDEIGKLLGWADGRKM